MENQIKAIAELAEDVINGGAYKATRFFMGGLDKKDVTVKVTRKMYKGKFLKKTVDLIVTIGPPNYEDRERIKRAKKAGETLDTLVKFPAKGVK